MSRIDEALKRAEAANAEARGRVSPIVRPNRRVEEVTLDHYPAENPSPQAQDAYRPADDEWLRKSSPGPERAAARRAPAESPQPEPFDGGFDGKLVIGGSASPVPVEQFRRLAGVMHELQVERDLKTLMVTSALPREGKTLTVCNLALTLANSYARRVLLIDADLRRPSVHEVLKVPNSSGVVEALRSNSADYPFRRVTPLLTVLTAGRPQNNPMALLTSERMQRLLDDSAAQFDWVLLDTPPVGFMPDAALLARMTRAILFVISAGSTPYQLVQRATAELGPDCIVGTVLNRIDASNIPATGYYRDYYAAESER
jgi:protein-tyrosine kinase